MRKSTYFLFRPALSRLASFSSLYLIGAIAPLAVLPVVARIGGVGSWAAVTMAQAVGSVAGVIVSLGFGLVGPARLANLPTDSARSLYATVQAKKLLAYVVICPPAAAVSAALATDPHRLLAASIAIASATSGLSLAWFAIGTGRAYILALYECLPKLISSVVALGAVALTQNVFLYPVLIWFFTVGGIAAFWLRMGIRKIGPNRRARIDWHAFTLELAAILYVAAPLIVAGIILSVAEVSQLGSIDKVYRYALYCVIALTSSTIAWALETGRTISERRNISLIFVIVGTLGFCAILVWGTAATAILFGEAVAAPPETCLGYAIAYLCVASSTPLVQFFLIPSGASRSVLAITATCAIIGLPTMSLFASMWGASGLALGFGMSECANLLLLSATIYRHHRTGKLRLNGA